MHEKFAFPFEFKYGNKLTFLQCSVVLRHTCMCTQTCLNGQIKRQCEMEFFYFLFKVTDIQGPRDIQQVFVVRVPQYVNRMGFGVSSSPGHFHLVAQSSPRPKRHAARPPQVAEAYALQPFQGSQVRGAHAWRPREGWGSGRQDRRRDWPWQGRGGAGRSGRASGRRWGGRWTTRA